MLIGNCALFENNQQSIHLCLIPHNVGNTILPVKVDLLDHTDGAVAWIGVGESVKVEVVPEERAKIITVLRPAILYITAPTGDQPGVKVAAVKVVYKDDGKHELFYLITGGDWKRFSALDER